MHRVVPALLLSSLALAGCTLPSEPSDEWTKKGPEGWSCPTHEEVPVSVEVEGTTRTLERVELLTTTPRFHLQFTCGGPPVKQVLHAENGTVPPTPIVDQVYEEARFVFTDGLVRVATRINTSESGVYLAVVGADEGADLELHLGGDELGVSWRNVALDVTRWEALDDPHALRPYDVILPTRSVRTTVHELTVPVNTTWNRGLHVRMDFIMTYWEQVEGDGAENRTPGSLTFRLHHPNGSLAAEHEVTSRHDRDEMRSYRLDAVGNWTVRVLVEASPDAPPDLWRYSVHMESGY